MRAAILRPARWRGQPRRWRRVDKRKKDANGALDPRDPPSVARGGTRLSSLERAGQATTRPGSHDLHLSRRTVGQWAPTSCNIGHRGTPSGGALVLVRFAHRRWAMYLNHLAAEPGASLADPPFGACESNEDRIRAASRLAGNGPRARGREDPRRGPSSATDRASPPSRREPVSSLTSPHRASRPRTATPPRGPGGRRPSGRLPAPYARG